ncbi:MAG: hypothetical protein GX605_00065, partial [Chloroflexi bacterium]|nr:hypothetical protein [Chloroflexota bacterium]
MRLPIPSWAQRVRRNHALEHATMHLLARRHPSLELVARSELRGFYVYGDVATDALAAAASEGLRRLQAGEANLAIHPRCGTNLAAAGILGGLASFTVMLKHERSPWDKLPQVLLASVAAVVLAQPLGLLLQQRVTTQADLQ